jgi:hypothetical protein
MSSALWVMAASNRRNFRVRRRDTGGFRDIYAVETIRANTRGATERFVGTNLDVTARNLAERCARAKSDYGYSATTYPTAPSINIPRTPTARRAFIISALATVGTESLLTFRP